jgi:hypothetical protein
MKRLFKVVDRDGTIHYFDNKPAAKAKRDEITNAGFKARDEITDSEFKARDEITDSEFKAHISRGPDHWRGE